MPATSHGDLRHRHLERQAAGEDGGGGGRVLPDRAIPLLEVDAECPLGGVERPVPLGSAGLGYGRHEARRLPAVLHREEASANWARAVGHGGTVPLLLLLLLLLVLLLLLMVLLLLLLLVVLLLVLRRQDGRSSHLCPCVCRAGLRDPGGASRGWQQVACNSEQQHFVGEVEHGAPQARGACISHTHREGGSADRRLVRSACSAPSPLPC